MFSRFINAAILAVAAALCAWLIQPTLANGQPAPAAGACPDIGRYAVGGYPQVGIVPAGYTPVHTPGGIFPWERSTFNHGQAVGAANVIAAVDAFTARCPGVPVDLYGYSYGAAVVHTAVETLDTRPYAGQVSVQLYGNPRHPGGIEDTYRGWIFPGVYLRGAARTPVNVASFTDRCNYGRDIICDAPHFLRDPLGALAGIGGYLGSGHTYS